ncbi:MAG: signal recognition particle-docking protein FtsY [Chloroflexi bacterium]|nr:signal recognition particle-docking protein FtsY [Chloroflexota bacterium]
MGIASLRERIEQGVRRTREAWFGRAAGLFQGPALSAATWEELEETLIAADVGVATTDALLEQARRRLEGRREGLGPLAALGALKEEMVSLLGPGDERVKGLLEPDRGRPGPLAVLVMGVNGSGKTTSIAKLARYYQAQGRQVILGAADTFRAAGIEQLEVWGHRLGIPVVAHRHGGDPAAVAFDTFQAGKARGADVVIIDTAGRLHTKTPLMEELKKVRRVLGRLDPEAPHAVLLVLDASTGQNGLAQARAFTEALGCHGAIVAKLDGTAKGGVLFSIRRELGLPVLFVGTGETAEDLAPFDAREFVEALFEERGQDTAQRDGGA